ncbi:hypothetical protein GIB67_042333 [Kingdonia uniflora]|uniref:BHLH domain-containing protein n=1 Tax=Kingdonia uniflora TaxID=39325 RepID=A0A7J7LEF0_9MAGN|nr:hypothetical protein GIB67_042333 [Kingdonia uniflora]
MGDSLLDHLFSDVDFADTTKFSSGGDDFFSIFESLACTIPLTPFNDMLFSPKGSGGSGGGGEDVVCTPRLVSQKSTSSSTRQDSETEVEASPSSKKRKISALEEVGATDGQQRVMHITVERNRRKQMNENLSVLRTLMPSFYVKRGDQASIIGGVVDYIKELQQVLQSLEARKQRKIYSQEVLSPRVLSSSPRISPLISPRKPPLSPRLVLNLPISPRTPKQPTSPYKLFSFSTITSPSKFDFVSDIVANSKSPVAEVEVKFSGPNVLLKTVSARIPGQAMKIIVAIEALSLEILHVSINTVDNSTMINSFTIKIGVECKLSAEELAYEVQQTFC